MKFQENPPMDAETQPKTFLFSNSDLHYWPTATKLISFLEVRDTEF